MMNSQSHHIGKFAWKVAVALVIFPPVFAFAPPCLSETFMAKALSVSDGDTITVLHDGNEEVIRLNGIDCPEKNQAYGRKAQNFTTNKVMNEIVTVDAKGIDRDGRTIGDVLLADGTNLSRELVQEGLAWWFFKHSEDGTLKALEIAARDEKRGLWRDLIPIPPWVFRKIKRKQVPEISDFQYPRVDSIVLGNKASKIYRHLGCKNFHTMLSQKNAIPFDTVEEAKEEGYHIARDCPRDPVAR